jgi:hypothetical protein
MKPHRPFGITLTVVFAAFVHGFIPLGAAGILVYLHNWIYEDTGGGFGGIQLTNFDVNIVIPASLAALVFIVLAGLTWWGRWSVMRLIFPAVTVFYSIFTFATVYQSQFNNPSGGADSLMEPQFRLREIYLIMIVGMTLYVWWFMNRWSARAFYRGYYTKQDLQLLQAAGVTASNETAPTP